jgi:hypothetical protein
MISNQMEIDLCEHLGIPLESTKIKKYDDWADTYQCKRIRS